MFKNLIIVALFIFKMIDGSSQHPLKHWMDVVETRYSLKDPAVDYILTVDPADFSFLSVEMRIRNISDTFKVAMVTHPEYDDRYWKYVENFSAKAKKGSGRVIRQDSSLWKIITNGR
jgi:hypothetical protein